MNYAVIYCVACLVLCTVSVTKRFGLRNIEYVGVDALTVTKRQLFGTFIIFSAITLFLPVLLQKLLRILLVNRNWSDASLDLATNGLSQLVLLSFVIYIYKCLHIKNMKQPWSSILGESLCGFGVALPVVWLVSYLWLTLLIFLNKCGLNVPLCEQGTVVLFTKLSGFFPKFLFSIMVVILAPIMEELIFRGGLYRAFRSNLSRRSAAILTSAIFATLHFNLVSLLPLYVLSFLLIKSYDRFGSILIPISIHAAFNCNSLLLILLFKAQI